MRTDAARTNRDQGFTLLELLVVTTLIVILLAILSPALDAALSHAERAACGGNLHAIGVGIGAYLIEFRKTPQKAGDPGEPQGDNWNNGYRMGGGHGDLETGDRAPEQRPLYAYVAPKAFKCPSDNIPYDNHGEAAPSRWQVTGSSYWMQPSAAEPDLVMFHVDLVVNNSAGPQNYFSGVIGRKSTSIQQPHKLIVLSDGPAWQAAYNFGAHTYSYHEPAGQPKTAQGRKNAWNNGLFTDGHAAYLHMAGVQDDFVTSEYSFAWNEFDSARMGSRGQ